MYFYMIAIFVLIISDYEIAGNAGQSSGTVERSQNFVIVSNYDKCKGKDSGNYSWVTPDSSDYSCNPNTLSLPSITYLVQYNERGLREVNGLQVLTTARFPAGAYIQTELLYLAIFGPLQGQYIYIKILWLSLTYLKKCSSDLGRSLIVSDKTQLLINDRLTPQVLISPTGAFEVFRKGCSTTCNGTFYFA